MMRPSPKAFVSGTVGGSAVSIRYGSPGVKGRAIWGDLVPFGQIWRAGANEATTIEVDKDVLIEGQHLPAGKYSLYTLPDNQEWTIIFNRIADQWGTEYDEKEDVLRVKAKPFRSDEPLERLAYALTDNEIILMWEHLKLPIGIASVE